MHLQNLLYQINELVVLELQKYLTDRNYNVHNCFFLLFPKCHFFQNCFRTNSAPTINTKTSRNMCSIGIKPANSPSIIFINLLRNNFEFEPLKYWKFSQPQKQHSCTRLAKPEKNNILILNKSINCDSQTKIILTITATFE